MGKWASADVGDRQDKARWWTKPGSVLRRFPATNINPKPPVVRTRHVPILALMEALNAALFRKTYTICEQDQGSSKPSEWKYLPGVSTTMSLMSLQKFWSQNAQMQLSMSRRCCCNERPSSVNKDGKS